MRFIICSFLVCLSFCSDLKAVENFQALNWWPWGQDQNQQKVKTFNLSRVDELEELLSKRVIGQPWAVKGVSDALLVYKAQIYRTNRPIGCFLFIGESGVGKTELAKALAIELGATSEQFLHLNMSEYNGHPGLYRLIGVPYGYINNEMGGELSNALLKTPYSVVLLDEFEKTTFEVRALFLHIFDEGFFESSHGERVDCKNCIFVATTNAGSDEIRKQWGQVQSAEEMLQLIKPQLYSVFSPELYNRMEPILFQSIDPAGLGEIIRLKLQNVTEGVYENTQIEIYFDDSVVDYIVNRCIYLNNGPRSILHIIKADLLSVIAKALIKNTYQKGDRLWVTYENSSFVLSRI